VTPRYEAANSSLKCKNPGRKPGVFVWHDGIEKLPAQLIAYVVARALFAFQRMMLWEIPFMPARFVWFRAAVSLPFPFLAAALAMVIGKP
jgi:hypothetical protein